MDCKPTIKLNHPMRYNHTCKCNGAGVEQLREQVHDLGEQVRRYQRNIDHLNEAADKVRIELEDEPGMVMSLLIAIKELILDGLEVLLGAFVKSAGLDGGATIDPRYEEGGELA